MSDTRLAFPVPETAVKGLLIANGVVFLIGALVGTALWGEPLASWLAVSWEALFDGYGLGFLRLITYQFAHDYGSIFHILFNMLLLYFFGTLVEGEVGKRGLLHLYLVGGVVAAVVQLALHGVTGDSNVRVLGASGSCYAILLYATCMAPRAPVYFFLIRLEMRWLAGILIAIGLYSTMLDLRHGISDGVAHGAHLGGALYGWLAFRHLRGYYLSLNFSGGALMPGLHRWRSQREHRQREHLRAELDRVLDKVQREGMGSLTAAERRVLDRASRDAKRR